MWINVDVILCVFWFLSFMMMMMLFNWVFKQTSNPPSIDQLKQASDPPCIDQIKQTSDPPCIDQIKQTSDLPRTDQLSCIDQLKEELLCAVSFFSHFYSAFVSFLLCF
jgi:hypothetical protein